MIDGGESRATYNGILCSSTLVLFHHAIQEGNYALNLVVEELFELRPEHCILSVNGIE